MKSSSRFAYQSFGFQRLQITIKGEVQLVVCALSPGDEKQFLKKDVLGNNWKVSVYSNDPGLMVNGVPGRFIAWLWAQYTDKDFEALLMGQMEGRTWIIPLSSFLK